MDTASSCTVGFRSSAVRVRVTPVLFRVISDTLMLLTVILQVAFVPLPSEALQVMTAVPFFRAVTLPVPSTSAISGLSLVHLTFR